MNLPEGVRIEQKSEKKSNFLNSQNNNKNNRSLSPALSTLQSEEYSRKRLLGPNPYRYIRPKTMNIELGLPPCIDPNSTNSISENVERILFSQKVQKRVENDVQKEAFDAEMSKISSISLNFKSKFDKPCHLYKRKGNKVFDRPIRRGHSLRR